MAPRSRILPTSLLASLCLVTAGCGTPSHTVSTAAPTSSSPVHPAVQRAQAEVAHQLQHADTGDVADAKRGFIAAPSGQVRNEAGQVIWDHDAFAFQQEIPAGNWMYPVIDQPLPKGFEQMITVAKPLSFTSDEVAANRKNWIREWLQAVTQ